MKHSLRHSRLGCSFICSHPVSESQGQSMVSLIQFPGNGHPGGPQVIGSWVTATPLGDPQ